MAKRRSLTPWLVGLLVSALLLLGLYVAFGLRYENSDDMPFVKGFLGFEGGVPISFSLYTHTLLTWALHGLSVAFPGIAWFSLLQVALLWFSMAAIIKACIQLSGRGVRLVVGLVGAGLYAILFCAFAASRITYTTTAALACAAAILQLMTLDSDDGSTNVSGYLLSVGLLLMAYMLRKIVVLPALAYVALLFAKQLVLCIRRKTSVRSIALRAVSLAAAFAVLAAIGAIETAIRGLQHTLVWQDSRITLMDYTPFEQDIAPALQANAGLSAPQTELVQGWYFMDAAIDTNALDTMAAAYRDVPKEDVFQKLQAFFLSNRRYVLAAVFLCLLAMLAAVCGGGLTALCAALGVVGGAIMLIYLSGQGRVLFRGVDTVFFPMGAMLLGLSLKGIRDGIALSRIRRVLCVLVCALLVFTAGADAYLTKDVLTEQPDAISQQREGDLEAFALQNPDYLIVRTPNLLRDTRLFPNVSGGIPANTMIWGDWYCRLPGWHTQMTRFGFDATTFRPANWANSKLLFATNEDAPPAALVTSISEDLGRPVAVEAFAEYGTLRFFSFR